MISLIIFLYALIIFASTLLDYFPKYQNEVWAQKMKWAGSFLVNPIRAYLPKDMPFDAAPWISIILLIMLQQLFKIIVYIYTLLIIVDTILSFFPHYRNEMWAQYIKKLADYSLNPIRQYLPKDLPLDFSPIIAIILLQLLVLLHWF